jgi:VWFA-related protein
MKFTVLAFNLFRLSQRLRFGGARSCSIALLFFCAAHVAYGQRIPPEISPDEEIVEVETDLVHIDAMVTDAEGRPVKDLKQTDFKLYEDGTERPVAFFNIEQRAGAERPVAVVFALDVSGSMTSRELERLRSAVGGFARSLNRNSSVFAVMSFGMRVRTLQNFTDDLGKIDKAFDRLQRDESGLSTHAYDAVDDAVRMLARRAPRVRGRQPVKRVVLLITDGFPVGDTVAPNLVIERANRAEVSVFSVTLPSYSRLLAPRDNRKRPLPTPLDVSGLVERTGGMNVYASDEKFDELFRRLAEDVNSAYVLSFYPSEEKRRDGRFHTLRVETNSGLFVRQNRPGYIGRGQRSEVRDQ